MEDVISGNAASHPRNKLIAAIFKEAGVIEKYGSGIKRVHRIMAEAGTAVPRFEIVANCFKVTLFPVGGVNGGVSEGVKALYAVIQDEPGKRLPCYAEKLDAPAKTVERWLKQLRDKKEIEYRGSPRTGGYHVA